jgi:hypothetical protein
VRQRNESRDMEIRKNKCYFSFYLSSEINEETKKKTLSNTIRSWGLGRARYARLSVVLQ